MEPLLAGGARLDPSSPADQNGPRQSGLEDPRLPGAWTARVDRSTHMHGRLWLSAALV